jgi:hypothetical protein
MNHIPEDDIKIFTDVQILKYALLHMCVILDSFRFVCVTRLHQTFLIRFISFKDFVSFSLLSGD